MHGKLIVICWAALACVVLSACVSAEFDACKSAFDRAYYDTAKEQCHPLAEQGNADAQYMLGNIYLYGYYVAKDPAEAVKWYRKAAEQNHAEAQTHLGTMYRTGWGVPQDYTEAAKWLRKAAILGDVAAQDNLGFMYANGQGVPRDYVKAHAYLGVAAAQGDDRSRASRDTLAQRMTQEQIAKAQRMANECAKKEYKGCEF